MEAVEEEVLRTLLNHKPLDYKDESYVPKLQSRSVALILLTLMSSTAWLTEILFSPASLLS